MRFLAFPLQQHQHCMMHCCCNGINLFLRVSEHFPCISIFCIHQQFPCNCRVVPLSSGFSPLPFQPVFPPAHMSNFVPSVYHYLCSVSMLLFFCFFVSNFCFNPSVFGEMMVLVIMVFNCCPYTTCCAKDYFGAQYIFFLISNICHSLLFYHSILIEMKFS